MKLSGFRRNRYSGRRAAIRAKNTIRIKANHFTRFLPYKVQNRITYKMGFAEHETGQDNTQVIVLFIKILYYDPESEGIGLDHGV